MKDCMDIGKNATIEDWQYQHEKARYAAYAEVARIAEARRAEAMSQAAEYANGANNESDIQ